MACLSNTHEAAALASSSRFIAQTPFLLYKALISAYFFYWCVRWPMEYSDVFLYVTYWSWYMGALYFFLSTITALLKLHRGPARNRAPEVSPPSWQEESNRVLSLPDAQLKIPTWEQVLLTVQGISGKSSCVSSLVVATVYWSFLYTGGSVSSVDINAHSMFACIMVLDQLIVATSYQLRDIWMPELFGVTYLTFNIIWFVEAPTGYNVIYPILDWTQNLEEALIFSLGSLFGLIPVFTLAHYGLFRLREFLYTTCQKHVQNPPTLLSSALLEASDSLHPAETC